MDATLERMAKTKPPTESVRIRKEVARKARMAAAALDLSVPDYLSDKLEPLIEAELQDLIAGMSDKPKRRPKP